MLCNNTASLSYSDSERRTNNNESCRWDVDFPLIHQCLDRPHSPPKRRLDRFTHLYTTTQQCPHWFHWGSPHPPKIAPCRGTIANPNYLPHPWTQATHHRKRHPDPISRFSTIHQTGRQTDRQTHRWDTLHHQHQYPLTHYMMMRLG